MDLWLGCCSSKLDLLMESCDTGIVLPGKCIDRDSRAELGNQLAKLSNARSC